MARRAASGRGFCGTQRHTSQKKSCRETFFGAKAASTSAPLDIPIVSDETARRRRENRRRLDHNGYRPPPAPVLRAPAPRMGTDHEQGTLFPECMEDCGPLASGPRCNDWNGGYIGCELPRAQVRATWWLCRGSNCTARIGLGDVMTATRLAFGNAQRDM